MSDQLHCAVSATAVGHLVTVSGEVDMATAPMLAEALAQFANGSVVVDLADVTFLDSSGLNALAAAQRHIERRGATLTVQGANPQVQRILELTGFDKLFSAARAADTAKR